MSDEYRPTYLRIAQVLGQVYKDFLIRTSSIRVQVWHQELLRAELKPHLDTFAATETGLRYTIICDETNNDPEHDYYVKARIVLQFPPGVEYPINLDPGMLLEDS